MTTHDVKPPITVTVRPVTLHDVTRLQQSCWNNRSLEGITEFIQRTHKLRAQQRGLGVVAERDQSVCGFGLITLWPRTAEISDLIVAPSYRDQGVGTQIISYLSHIAHDLNATIVEIGVAESNPRALALYSRLGFVKYRTMQIDLGNGPETVLYLEKRVRPHS